MGKNLDIKVKNSSVFFFENRNFAFGQMKKTFSYKHKLNFVFDRDSTFNDFVNYLTCDEDFYMGFCQYFTRSSNTHLEEWKEYDGVWEILRGKINPCFTVAKPTDFLKGLFERVIKGLDSIKDIMPWFYDEGYYLWLDDVDSNKQFFLPEMAKLKLDGKKYLVFVNEKYTTPMLGIYDGDSYLTPNDEKYSDILSKFNMRGFI